MNVIIYRRAVVLDHSNSDSDLVLPNNSEICLPRKAFLTFSFTKGRQAPFQLVLRDEEELHVREFVSPGQSSPTVA